MTTLEKIGKYQVLGVLGQGGMGVVYKALDPSIGRNVAIKTIHKHLLSSSTGADKIARFTREAQAAGRFLHPNIVTVFEYGDHEGTPYLVMEFVEGRELTDILSERRSLSPVEALDIFSQVCAGLDHAHRKEVVHRDLKPANIFVLPDGTVKIADFGIARIQDAELGITGAGEILGTPYYMSPEQLTAKNIDARSDLFSLAVVIYEALTGERPFSGEAVTGVLLKILQDNPAPPTSISPTIPAAFDAFFSKALDKNPEQRFQTATELQRALAQSSVSRGAGGATQSGSTPGTVSSSFRPEDLTAVESALTKRLGPISKVIIKRKSVTLSSLGSLIDALALEITNETERQRFISELSNLRSAATSREESAPAGITPAPGRPTGPGFDVEFLTKLETVLTSYLGPMAKIIVKRTASLSTSKEELCNTLSLQIANADDRKRFLAQMASDG